MVYIFAFLLIFSVYCTIKSYISKYSWFFLIIIWSLIGLLYISLIRIATTGNYFTVDWFNDFDSRIFIAIIKKKVKFFTIVRLFNLFSVIYFITLICFVKSYIMPTAVIKKYDLLVYITPVLISLIYMWFYDPDTTYNLYRYIIIGKLKFFWIGLIDLGFYVCICCVPIILAVTLATKYKLMLSIYKQKQLIGVCLFIVLSLILLATLYHLSGVRQLYFSREAVNIIRPQIGVQNYNNTYTLVMLVLIGCMFYITINFNIIRQEGLISRFIIKMQTQSMNKNFYKTFHSVKNIIFSYKLLLNRAQNADGEEHEALLNELSNKMERYIDRLSLMISADNNLGDFSPDRVYVSDFLDEVISKVNLPDNIVISKDYEKHKEEILADTFYLSDALVNILQNAMQAIESSGNESGAVNVSVNHEFEWIVIAISDNGVGMSRKTQKSIFDPFFTTKSRINNWGVGLSFTQSIIKYHKGKICFKSKKNQGTTFYILLPSRIQ